VAAVRPSAARTAWPASVALAAVRSWVIDGLIAQTRRKRPSAAGEVIKASADAPPADSPNTVTLAGSPPIDWTFFATHRSASIWSSRPRLPATAKRSPASGRWVKPNTPSR
jgi:hypothetical protein